MRRHLIHLLMALLFLTVCGSCVFLMSCAHDAAAVNEMWQKAKGNIPSGSCDLTVPQGHADASLLKKPGSLLTSADINMIAVDGKVYDIPLDMEKILSDFDYETEQIRSDYIDGQKAGYNVKLGLYREEIKIFTIGCYSESEEPAPSDLEFSYLSLYNTNNVIQSGYMPEVILGGMDVRTTSMEDYLRLTGQENEEYFYDRLVNDNPDGSQTVLTFDAFDAGDYTMTPFINLVRYCRDGDKYISVYFLKENFCLPDEDIALPEKIPYETYQKCYEDYLESLPDNYSDAALDTDADKNAQDCDISLYELMQLLDKSGHSSEFYIEQNKYSSDDRYYTYEGERYMRFTMRYAEGDIRSDIMVFLKIGDPVLGATVVSMENDICELIK